MSAAVRDRRWLWLTVAVLIGWGLWAADRGNAGLPDPVAGASSDLKMYAAITARVSEGENYHRVLAQELAAGGYATRPVFNWRLPTLTWLNSLPPSHLWGRALLVLLGVATIVLWLIALRISVPRAAIAGVPVLLFGIGPLLFFDPFVGFYEVWGGLFIAASLACHGAGRWRWSVALGAAGSLVRELVVPYLVIMAAAAWREGRRREAAAWLGAVGVFAAFWVWHVTQVMKVMPPEGLVNSWAVAGGWPFVLKASHASLFLMLVPDRIEATVIALAVPPLWAGSWHWRDGLGRRVAFVLTGYFALFMIVGRPDNWYWGFLIAPLIPLAGFGYFWGSRSVARD